MSKPIKLALPRLFRLRRSAKLVDMDHVVRAPIIHNGYQYKSFANFDPLVLTHVHECHKLRSLLALEPGWYMCTNTPETLHVCAIQTYPCPWEAYALVFADGSAAYTNNSNCTGILGLTAGEQAAESGAFKQIEHGLFGIRSSYNVFRDLRVKPANEDHGFETVGEDALDGDYRGNDGVYGVYHPVVVFIRRKL